MCLLSEKNFFATGTVRANRLNGAVLKTGKNLPRGASDYTFDKTNQILFVRWSDNKEVTMASNHQVYEPMARTKRYNKVEKKKMMVDLPQLIQHYNRHMCGVDLHDNAVSNYRIRIRGKKWWWSLFTSGLDSCAVNAWKLHCLIAKKINITPMHQIDFRVKITEALLLTEDPDTENMDDGDNDGESGKDKDGIQLVTGKHLVVRDTVRARCRPRQPIRL